MAKKRKLKAGGLILFLTSFSGLFLCREIMKLAYGLPVDDAYIFKRYVFNIISGSGFSFNPGEPSFGCSSFLWTAWLAVLTKIAGKGHYFAIAQWSGILFTCLAVWYFLKMVSIYTRSAWLTLLGAFLGWLSATTFMNAISGMESGLFSFLVMFSLYRFIQIEGEDSLNGFFIGLSSALAFLTRPEGLYFAIALSAIWLYKLIRNNKSVIITWLTFLFGFSIPSIPFLVWTQLRFHQFLPFTYLGKIYGSDPDFLNRSFSRKFQDGIGFLLEGWSNLIGGWRAVGIGLIICALIALIYALFKFLYKPKDNALVLVSAWMLLPFVYGFAFPVSPHFGGYYQRYISSVYLVMIFLGITGLNLLLRKVWGKSVIYLSVLVLSIIYCLPIVKAQIKHSKDVYIHEVSLNQGIRKDAANWLKEKTPEKAKILVGHTGLGVVGGECERYVYDLGGLINLDLIPYLQGTKPLTQPRWEKILKYICAKEVDYYVSFAPLLGVDPAKSPGISEVAKIGTQEQPKSAYEQIIIYQIERNALCAQEKEQGEGNK